MIPGGGTPRPKVQILDILGNSQNNGYFSRLRRYRKHSPDNTGILHCIAPQGRKFWGLGGFTMFLFIFAISHAYFLMFSYIILIYLCKLPYFTYHLGRGDPPDPKFKSQICSKQDISQLFCFCMTYGLMFLGVVAKFVSPTFLHRKYRE